MSFYQGSAMWHTIKSCEGPILKICDFFETLFGGKTFLLRVDMCKNWLHSIRSDQEGKKRREDLQIY